MLACSDLLLAGRFSSLFNFCNKHKDAYLYLRNVLALHLLGNVEFPLSLQPPLGAAHWILQNQAEIERH